MNKKVLKSRTLTKGNCSVDFVVYVNKHFGITFYQDLWVTHDYKNVSKDFFNKLYYDLINKGFTVNTDQDLIRSEYETPPITDRHDGALEPEQYSTYTTTQMFRDTTDTVYHSFGTVEFKYI